MMAVEFVPIETERLLLRRFVPSDVEPFLAYRSDAALARYQGWGVITPEEARRFVDAQLNSNPGQPGTGAQIAVELKATAQMIGDVYLNSPADRPHEAEIGYTLAPGHHAHGYATEAVTGLLGFVFGALDRHRVTALTYADNTRSVALLERLGMRREAHFVKNQWFEGKWVDEYIYAMLQSEWPSLQQNRDRKGAAKAQSELAQAQSNHK